MDVSNLSRYQKGYLYEYEIWNSLKTHNVEYSSNPQTYSEWLKTTNTGYDIKVKINDDLWLKVECKYTSKPIYHSWFVRDWNSRDCDVIVTNCKWHVPFKDRELLREKNIKLFDTHEFLAYILKLCRDGNKYYLNLQSYYFTSFTTVNIDQAENGSRLISSSSYDCFVPPERIISSMSLAYRHINGVGFSSTYTVLSGLEGGFS